MKELSYFKENNLKATVFRDMDGVFYVEYYKEDKCIKYTEFKNLQDAEDSAEDWVMGQ